MHNSTKKRRILVLLLMLALMLTLSAATLAGEKPSDGGEGIEATGESAVTTGETAKTGFDISYLLALQGLREKAPWLGKAAERFCELNALLLPALCVFIYLSVDKRIGRIALFNFGAGELANLAAKNLACVPRPYLRDARIVPVKFSSSYSFPSGHAMYASSIYGTFGAWQSRRRKWLSVLCIVMIALTGFFRNLVGAHTPQDVIASIVLTFAVMYAMTHILLWLERNPEKTFRFLYAGLGFGVLMTALALLRHIGSNRPDISTEVFSSFGRWCALLLMLAIDQRLIRYEIPKNPALRYSAGILGAGICIAATLLTNGKSMYSMFAAWLWVAVYAAVLVLIPAAVTAVSKRNKAE